MVYKVQNQLIAARNSLFILLIAALAFSGCGDDIDRQTSQPPSGVEQEISRFSLVRSQGGRVKWKLDAEATTLLDSDRVRLRGVKLVIFGDKDGGTLTIHGDQGEVNERTNDIKVMGKVEGVSSDGGRLTTEEIHWRDATGRIYTSPGVEVTIIYEDSTIVGEGLEARPELETAILRNVKGITRAEEKAK